MRDAAILVSGFVVLALLLGSAGAVRAQRATEEWNALQDINRTQDPNERLQVIEVFLKTYPESKYRVYVYPNMLETAYSVQNYAKAMDAVDAFLVMDKQQILTIFREGNPNLEESSLEGTYYRFNLVYTLSFLQSFRENNPKANEIAGKAAERAAKALLQHDPLWAAAKPPPGVTPEQFKQIKNQEENSLHTTLAFLAWRNKEYAKAAQEYSWLVERAPEDARLNYQLALSMLQLNPADYRRGFWYLGRAIGLNIPKSDEVKDYLKKSLALYQQVPPECLNDQVNDLIADSAAALHPSAEWKLASAEQVNALREDLVVKKIFDDLKAGGESAHLMYLASCGMTVPELQLMVLEVNQTPGNLVTLRGAVTQESADAKQSDLEVKVDEPIEARSLKVEDVVRVSGKITGYQSEPFLLKLAEGKVNPEDIPKTRR